MKLRFMISLLINGVLVISAGAQDRSAQTTNSAIPHVPRQQPSSTATRPAQTQVPPGSRDANAYPQASSDSGEETIVVAVWSSALPVEATPKEADPAKLSPSFAVAALSAATRIQFTQRKIANSIKMGFPPGEFWIQIDFDFIEDSLRLAALSVTTEADRQALQQLQNQTNRLRVWCDWLIDQNQDLALANYLTSPAPLDNDEPFQNTVACTKFLLLMLATGRLEEEDRSCS